MFNMSDSDGIDGEKGHYVRRVISKDENGIVTVLSQNFVHGQ